MFFDGRIVLGVAGFWLLLVMIIVAPLCEVVREFETWCVGRGVLEVDNDELFVTVRWEEERRFGRWEEAENISVLCLFHFVLVSA